MSRDTVEKRYKAATKYRKTSARKAPRKGKTTVKPIIGKGKVGVKIKRTF